MRAKLLNTGKAIKHGNRKSQNRLQLLVRGAIDVGLVLFVCSENSFRSQMAEAYFNKLAPKGWKAVSAGLKPASSVHPNAVKIMLEDGIDIGDKTPQLLTRELQEAADMVVVVCSGLSCPSVKAKHVEVWSLPDPADMPLEEAKKVRDEIKKRVLKLVKRIERDEIT
jgi:protein-tyrosine-phosphatase